MNKTARRLTRILSMLPWVIANPGATVDDVCERFGYSRRELLADLDLVFVCGLPGYGPGDLMVAYVEGDEVVVDMADYFANPVRLNPPEALGLLAAGLTLKSSGQATPALERAVEKLSRALLPDPGAFEVVVESEPSLIQELRTAAAQRKAVAIVYTSLSTGTTTQRVVEPWAVFASLGNWYLAGFCRRARAERLFRIDRIQSIEVTDEDIEPPAELPSPEVRFTPSEDSVYATIRLSPMAQWVKEYYPVEEVSDGTIRFAASDPLVAARLLLRLGAHAELVEGQEVAEALSALRNRLRIRYEV